MKTTRILIAGGGFARLYAAIHFDKRLARRADVEVTLISRENFILFTPMLREVAAGDLRPRDRADDHRARYRRAQRSTGANPRANKAGKVNAATNKPAPSPLPLVVLTPVASFEENNVSAETEGARRLRLRSSAHQPEAALLFKNCRQHPSRADQGKPRNRASKTAY
jgi:hypothetical protein